MNELVKRPTNTVAAGLLALIQDPDIGTDKLELLLQLQRDMISTQAKEDFFSDFARLSAVLPQIEKRGVVDLMAKDGRRLGGYHYARWEDMDKAIRPLLAEYGFSLNFVTRVTADDQTVMRGTLMHTSGHSIDSERKVSPDKGPGRNDAQAEGSGTSYAKRYLAEGLLNLVRKGQDDDGLRAGEKLVSAEQVGELSRLISDVKSEPEKFLATMVTGVSKLEHVPERDYPRLVNALNARKAAMEKAK